MSKSGWQYRSAHKSRGSLAPAKLWVGLSFMTRAVISVVCFAASLVIASIANAAQSAQAPTSSGYHITRTVKLGSPDRWDYLTFDAPSHRVYVAHGDRVTVVDGQEGTVLGQIEGFPGGTHGIAISHATGAGYSDDGRAGTVSSFDLQSFKLLQTVKAEPDADGIVLDTHSGNLFVMDGDSGKITVIEPRSNAVVATAANSTSMVLKGMRCCESTPRRT